MKERLVNIFVYGDETHVHAVGWRLYKRTGTYDEQTTFLQARAWDDHRIAARKNLDEPVTWREFEAMDRLNPVSGAFVGAGVVGENDGHCVTQIVNGQLAVDDTFDSASGGAVPDYLEVYSTENGIDFPRLFRDDYFEAIHLLWNNRKYVSCLKLVFSAMDTWGFVEYGPDVQDGFTRWLDQYCDLGQLGVTSAELWELRNSLIHMTSLDSRKVRAGKAHRLLPRFTDPDHDVSSFVNGMKVFHVARFVMVVLPGGLAKWLQSYNQERTKFPEFVERYDTVVSEARVLFENTRR